jgi:hypothetical protein
MSRPIALPVGPTRRAEMSTSGAGARAEIYSPSCRWATAVGTPQPSEALTAASGVSSRAASRQSVAPNTPVSSAGLELTDPERQQPDFDSSARASL